MRRLPAILTTLILSLTILLPACEGFDDDFSGNPSHRLSFSVDTLSFDTVFCTVGSTTRQFMIYNPNSEALNIESVLLAGAGTTGFRVNVDGRKGDRFENVGIRAKDSMYVFVEVTVDPNGKDQPLLVQDSILFMVNGIRQSVQLEAFGQDVKLFKNGYTIHRDTVLTAERPYLVYDNLVIAPDVTVEIAEGAVFYMHNKANVIVQGTLIAEGTQEKPVIFRGDRLDFVIYDYLPYDRTPGQWGGIFLQPESFGNKMNHVIIKNGTTGLTCSSSTADLSKLKFTNGQITNMAGNLFSAIDCHIEVTNSELSNASGVITALMGGNYQFTHCTLVNHMSISIAKRDSATLSFTNGKPEMKLPSLTLLLTNSMPEKQTAALSARFDNCVIDGSRGAGKSVYEGNGEILLNKTEGVEFKYHFNHCVMRINEEDKDSGFTEVYTIPKGKFSIFRSLGNRENKFVYDFQPDSVNTVGVGMADLTIAERYPVDRRGTNRLTSPDGPTIGAYEFVPAPDEDK